MPPAFAPFNPAPPCPCTLCSLKKLGELYAPSATVDDRFKGHDLPFVTNAAGEPMALFIGRRQPDGHITGQRCVPTISAELTANNWCTATGI